MRALAREVGGDLGEYIGSREDKKAAAKKLWRLKHGLLYAGLIGQKVALVAVENASVFDGRDNCMTKQTYFEAVLGVALEIEWI